MNDARSLSELVTPDFVARWEPYYDSKKYPVDFLLRYGDNARNARSPEHLKHALIALLHWKDGKTANFARGETRAAKPKTLNPILTLDGAAMVEFALSFRGLVGAEEKDFEERIANLRSNLNKLWGSVVIPAFLLHIARPERLPIIDQHTMRACLYLTRGEFVENPTKAMSKWDLWNDYIAFFDQAVVSAGFSSGVASRCYTDRALFAYGKWLKKAYPLEKKRRLEKQALTLPATKPGFVDLWEQIDAEATESAQSRSAGRNHSAE